MSNSTAVATTSGLVWTCPGCDRRDAKAPHYTKVCHDCTRRCDWLARAAARAVEDLTRMVGDLADLGMVWSAESAEFAGEALADLRELAEVASKAAQACRVSSYQDLARWANAS